MSAAKRNESTTTTCVYRIMLTKRTRTHHPLRLLLLFHIRTHYYHITALTLIYFCSAATFTWNSVVVANLSGKCSLYKSNPKIRFFFKGDIFGCFFSCMKVRRYKITQSYILWARVLPCVLGYVQDKCVIITIWGVGDGRSMSIILYLGTFMSSSVVLLYPSFRCCSTIHSRQLKQTDKQLLGIVLYVGYIIWRNIPACDEIVVVMTMMMVWRHKPVHSIQNNAAFLSILSWWYVDIYFFFDMMPSISADACDGKKELRLWGRERLGWPKEWNFLNVKKSILQKWDLDRISFLFFFLMRISKRDNPNFLSLCLGFFCPKYEEEEKFLFPQLPFSPRSCRN